MESCDVMRDGRNKDFRIGHYGRLRRLDKCYITEIYAWHFTVVLLGRYVFAGFLIVKTTVKTGKSSCVLIVTCLLKLSTQWVKYALACVYTDLPIGELKKKVKTSKFVQDITSLRCNWRLLVFFLVSSAMEEGNCRKERLQYDFSRNFKHKTVFVSRKDFFNTNGVGLGEGSSNKNID